MGHQASTLVRYAERRFVLSGTSVVKNQYPYCTSMEQLGVAASAAQVGVESFAHYDYLGLQDDPRILAAAKAAVDAIGVGAGASRLVGGERMLHSQLEQDLSDFIGAEATLCLVSGYGTNVALIGHLMTRGDLIIVDEASHNSIMVGSHLSRAEKTVFRHNDLAHLQDLLASKRARHNRTLVVVEGLYSMDGDIPDLPRLLELCRRHDAWLVVDEAHSIGVLGATGRGLCEHFGIAPGEVDLIVGTLSKTFVTSGGFISARRSVIEWLRYTLPGFVYSVGLPPPGVAAACEALRILRAEPERLARLHRNSAHFLTAARERGLDVGTAIGAAVVPVLFPTIPLALEAANSALAAGFYVPPIVQIAVPKDLPRLRFFITAAHRPDHIDRVLDALAPFAGRAAVVERSDAIDPEPA